MSSEKPIRIYALGGAGSNIAHFFEQDLDKGIHSMTYVDTSRANLKKFNIPNEEIYIFKNEHGQELDGAGKKRDEHAPLIQAQTPDVLNKHAPAKFNIVVFSLSGGSGSVAGPVLVANLLKRGERVICCVVSSFDDETQVKNTAKTFRGLAMASEGLKVPVILSYHPNGEDRAEDDINDDIREVITQLSVLFSGENDRLDSTDLNNFLKYDRIIGIEPGLTELSIHTGYDWTGDDSTPLVSCTLYPEGAPKLRGISPLYSCDGFMRPDTILTDTTTFTLNTDKLGSIVAKFAAEEKRYDDLRAARQTAPKIVRDEDKQGNDGSFLVL